VRCELSLRVRKDAGDQPGVQAPIVLARGASNVVMSHTTSSTTNFDRPPTPSYIMSAAQEVQTLLRFLSQDAKVPLAQAIGKVKDLQAAKLATRKHVRA
jgi:hypothetical protein